MLNKIVFIRELALLEERFNRDMQEAVLDRYYETLRDLTDAEFVRAARLIFDNDEFWPAPNRFIQLAHGTTKDAANQEWAILINACAQNNTNVPLSPTGITAMRRAGGWREIAYAEGPAKQEQLKRLFLAAYDTDTQQRQHAQLQNTTPRLLS